MQNDKIIVKGARLHNLKNIDVDNDNEWFKKYPHNPTKRELRKRKKRNKQIGTQIRRTKEKRELKELNVE